MNTISFVLIIATLCLHYAHASSLVEQDNLQAKEDNDLVKTTFSSGGSLYLGLNSTILWVAVLGLGALALAAYVFGVSSLLGGDDTSGYGNQRYSHYYDPDLQAANSPTALAALRYAQEAQAAQQSQASARSKRAMDESKFYLYCILHNLSNQLSENLFYKMIVRHVNFDQTKNAKIGKLACDILGNFQTLCLSHSNIRMVILKDKT